MTQQKERKENLREGYGCDSGTSFYPPSTFARSFCFSSSSPFSLPALHPLT